jgi:hypothetical protein
MESDLMKYLKKYSPLKTVLINFKSKRDEFGDNPAYESSSSIRKEI